MNELLGTYSCAPDCGVLAIEMAIRAVAITLAVLVWRYMRQEERS